MEKPNSVKINEKLYQINTDKNYGLECYRILENLEIGEYERTLAIIYKLFGEEGLNDQQNHQDLIDFAVYYLSCGKEETNNASSNKEPDMDYEQDKGKIQASFLSVYGIENIFDRYMHFWDFMDYMNGFTEDCALNYARYVRTRDISDIKDPKEKERAIKEKQEYALKKKLMPLTTKEQEQSDRFDKLAKLK